MGEHRDWCEKQGVRLHELDDLEAEQVGDLVGGAGSSLEIGVDDEARAEFVEGSDGTPEQIVASFLYLRQEKTTQVNAATARPLAQKKMADLWVDARHEIRGISDAAGFLLDGLADFLRPGW